MTLPAFITTSPKIRRQEVAHAHDVVAGEREQGGILNLVVSPELRSSQQTAHVGFACIKAISFPASLQKHHRDDYIWNRERHAMFSARYSSLLTAIRATCRSLPQIPLPYAENGGPALQVRLQRVVRRFLHESSV